MHLKNSFGNWFLIVVNVLAPAEVGLHSLVSRLGLYRQDLENFNAAILYGNLEALPEAAPQGSQGSLPFVGNGYIGGFFF